MKHVCDWPLVNDHKPGDTFTCECGRVWTLTRDESGECNSYWDEETPRSNRGLAAGWRRLQALSCAHAAMIGPQYGAFGRRRYVMPPEVIKENCEILGLGDEERIKARIHWYLTYYPRVFDAVSGTAL